MLTRQLSPIGILVFCWAVLVLSTGSVRADVPDLVTVQGRLTDASDVILPDGSYSIRFRVYDDEFAGNVVWESTMPVSVNDGLFTVSLPIPEAVFDSPDRWLGIKVDINPEGTPRSRLTSVGYAHRSGQWTSLGDNVYRAIGNTGVGTSTPLRRFHVYDGTGAPQVARFEGNSTVATILELNNTSNGVLWNQGVGASVGPVPPGSFYLQRSGSQGFPLTIGTNDWVGIGAPAPAANFHVYNPNPGDAIVARFEGSNQYATVTEISNTVNTARWQLGVGGPLASVGDGTFYIGRIGNGYGSLKINSAGALHGHSGGDPVAAHFENASDIVTVMELRNAVNSTTWQIGVGGPTSSVGDGSLFMGRIGLPFAPFIVGSDGHMSIGGVAPKLFTTLWVETSSDDAVAGVTTGDFSTGVKGLSSGASSWGVYGIGTEYAGYFNGNVRVTGTINPTAVTSTIDHPLDPANKLLTHSSVQCPDIKNIYDGVVVTDGQGDAIVTMPEWFEAVNRDFRYQLTAVGQFAQAIVSKKMAGNQFSIKTDQPNVEVSWQVTGIRQDAYANAHRPPVEELKPAKERGFYLHPELHGQPEEKGVTWAKRPEMMKQMKERREKATAAPK